MLSSARASALRQYRSSASAAATCDVSQHQLILMLFNGALESLGRADAAIQANDIKGKLKSVRSATEILGYLRGILNPRAGTVIAPSLGSLYEYMIRQLMRADALNDAQGLREVSRLLVEVKAGWESIPEAQRY